MPVTNCVAVNYKLRAWILYIYIYIYMDMIVPDQVLVAGENLRELLCVKI